MAYLYTPTQPPPSSQTIHPIGGIDMTLGGSCLCKAVSYEITGPLGPTGHCHCSICRKAHGAAFVTWTLINSEQFRWTSGLELVQGYESSPGRQRCFCRQCGSHLVSTEAGNVTEVVLATIDGDPGVRPEEHIFVDSKAPWYEITDGLPQSAAWPPGMDPSLPLKV
ncbi:Putative glutathione-dependent formaldehyde-activating enzyme [Halomicronema hongdechloris C2206]|uniref:Glutathione-dependent formaldehyde-activating enzyme n=1 Tax=Halomicronema hongdechloris C2206 TaxID=1641165 RepID=A0A1Z3HRM9_9CYAN|nr:GFA family protein [Halomicronema hongdechloris]ASC72938.1 Putative glutathione-dependent formaldehyde-activating enzyme [Halomicronema hongdechloris C2206]